MSLICCAIRMSKTDFIYKGESDEFMYGRYEFQDQGCRCDNKSGGQRAVNPSWEYDRPDDPARFGIGRFEKDREGFLVDGKKSVCTSALGCHDTANAFQMDRQTYRSKSENNAPVSNPSDATLMKKLSLKCKKLRDFLQKKKLAKVEFFQINLTWIVKKYQEYIFLAKNTVKAKRQEVFRELHTFVQKELRDFVKYVECLPRDFIESLPWNYLDIAKLISEDARRYLLDVGHFVMTGCMKKNKILSLKLRDVVCVKKGKLGKEKEFGRVFQLGRIGGNFLVPYFCTSLRMDDKETLPQVILEHLFRFNPKGPLSVATDKGYYSGYNVEFVKEMTGNADGIQRPANVKDQGGLPRTKELFNRRAGVEPLIGHAKRFGLGKSMMKSDEATLASGYRSVTGFNLHQLMRNLEGTSRLSIA